MMGRFECARCGKACRDTIWTNAGGDLFGLYLDAAEAERFPKDLIFPLLGRGDPIIATAWQLGVNSCPHYHEEGGLAKCAIYPNRPKICAAFPVTSRTTVSPHCTAIRKLVDGADADSLRNEIAAHQEKLEAMVSREPDEWMWPLNRKCWIPIVTGVYSNTKR